MILNRIDRIVGTERIIKRENNADNLEILHAGTEQYGSIVLHCIVKSI